MSLFALAIIGTDRKDSRLIFLFANRKSIESKITSNKQQTTSSPFR